MGSCVRSLSNPTSRSNDESDFPARPCWFPAHNSVLHAATMLLPTQIHAHTALPSALASSAHGDNAKQFRKRYAGRHGSCISPIIVRLNRWKQSLLAEHSHQLRITEYLQRVHISFYRMCYAAVRQMTTHQVCAHCRSVEPLESLYR
jgi:hypothetical protein